MAERNITVLVVEYDQHLLEGIRDILELDGYHVLIASNSLQALELTREHRPDLIFSEINLLPFNGYEFLKELRADPRISATPVIFSTTRSERYDLEKALFMGADEYIAKPYNPADLFIKTTTVLRKEDLLQPAREINKDNDVFFSYRLHDVKTMQHSIQYLTNAELSVLRPDRREYKRAIHDDLTITQLKRSRCVVALISEAPTRFNNRAFRSDFELEIARILGLPIFAVLIDGQIGKLPDRLKGTYVRDARQNADEVLKTLADDVHKYITKIRA